MIRALPIDSPAQGLDLDVPARDPATGDPTTLAALEQRASDRPTFANVRYLLTALDTCYPGWRTPGYGTEWRYMTEAEDRQIYGSSPEFLS